MSASGRTYRAGESLEDVCRVCKTDRSHTVIVVDGAGVPIRVACGYCGSEHNYRGGPRIEPAAAPRGSTAAATRTASPDRAPFPIVADRERTSPAMSLS